MRYPILFVRSVLTGPLAAVFLGLVLADASAHPINSPIVLEGTIVTPEAVISNGKIVIENDKITAVGVDFAVPPNSIRVKTNGVIYPGLIDLHNHMTWNVFPIWTPPRFFNNRYEWRAYEGYLNTYARWDRELRPVNCLRNKYAELKALLGGVTSIQGSLPNSPCVKGLVRNLDMYSGFQGPDVGKEKLLHVLDVEKITPEDAADYRQKLASKALTSLILHLAEGRRGDRESQDEFTLLASYGLLTEMTAIIHGTGLDDAAFALMGRKKVKLIWSPRSNIVLYGETADIRGALQHNVLAALAPDWSVTGSDNMLDELKTARLWFFEDKDDTGHNRDLVLMVTLNPAVIANVSDKIGRIQAGYMADLVVVRGDGRPYGTLVDARPQDIDLVMIGGQPYYGSPAVMQALGQASDAESLDVCRERKLLHLTYHNQTENPLNITQRDLIAQLTAAMAQVSEPKPQLAPLFSCR